MKRTFKKDSGEIVDIRYGIPVIAIIDRTNRGQCKWFLCDPPRCEDSNYLAAHTWHPSVDVECNAGAIIATIKGKLDNVPFIEVENPEKTESIIIDI